MTTLTDNSSTDINVVIIGETGAGKSTLINYLTNLFHNGSLNNLKIAIPTRYLSSNMSSIMPEHHESFLNDITHSKTSQCIKYQYEVKNVNFNFFDTPGINSTGGYLADNKNLENIFQCIQSCEYLTALVFVLNGTQARLTINIKNVLERFHERMPNVFYSNIIVILTNCSSHTVNIDSIDLLNNSPIFYMQNSAFSSDPQIWTEQTLEILQRDWNISIETMNEFIKTLLLFKPISTESLSNINHDRDAIRSILHESRLMIMELQHIEDELIALEQASHIYSENNTQTKTIQVNEITITPYHNTICLKCNIVCHERCSLTETIEIGEDVIRHCEIMDSGRCTICPGQCSYDMHYHDRRLIKNVSRKIRFAISSLSNKNIEDQDEKVACEIKCKTVQEAKHLFEQLLQEQFTKIQDACINIQENCQGFNVVEELYTCINLLKNELKSLRSKSVIHKTTKFIEQLETLANSNRLTSVSEPVYAVVTKRKTRNLRKRNQPTIRDDDDSMIFDESFVSTSRSLVDYIPTKMALIEDDSLTPIDTSKQETTNFLNNRNYSEYTTEQLIEFIRESMEKNALITQELNRRCKGTSIGYLSPTQLFTLCEYYTSARLFGTDELIRSQSQLQLEIQESTDSNPFEILSVPMDKLLRLTAIKLCLQNDDKYQ